MKYISYAQNREDVYLNRIFGSLSNGFYVDVGACHPFYDSVTKYFYDRGWRGINIEPLKQMFDLLEEHRQDDINLNCAVGAEKGLHSLSVTSSLANSTLNSELSKKYERQGTLQNVVEVDVKTLTDIWNEYVKDQHVNFLKIDVEGYEKFVLMGTDFSAVKADILIIESTLPNTKEQNHTEWEGLLPDEYSFIFFDGINRFYKHRDFEVDKSVYGYPPNVLDNFIPYIQLKLSNDVEYLTNENKNLKAEISRLSVSPDLSGEGGNEVSENGASEAMASQRIGQVINYLSLLESLAADSGNPDELERLIKSANEQWRASLKYKSDKWGEIYRSMDSIALTLLAREKCNVSASRDSLKTAGQSNLQQLILAMRQELQQQASLHDSSQQYAEQLVASLKVKDIYITSLHSDYEQKVADLNEAASAYESLLNSYKEKEREMKALYEKLENIEATCEFQAKRQSDE